MTLERLWAGWRATYVSNVATQPPPEPVAGDGTDANACLFERLAAADSEEALILARTDRVFAVMNAYPYTSGHLMIAPIAHEATLAGLTRDDATALMALTQDATVALQAAYQPEGINVGINMGRAAGAGIPGHVHVHVLPRWNGDTNFMTSVAEARVLPESLTFSYEKLRAAWPA